MKKRTLLLIALLLTALACFAYAEAPEDARYRIAWLDGSAYGFGTADVPVMILTNDPAAPAVTEESAAGEIFFFPFDPETGLYAAGEGEPAGDRVRILNLTADPVRYVVRLSEPGKYTISGSDYYLLDLQNPAQSALRRELDEAVFGLRGKTEAETAKKLHDWLCGRVSSVMPEDRPELAALCGDPVNALQTGYASRDAYARLCRMLLSTAGIRCLTVSGEAAGESASWNLCRTDGTWRFTDAALDDVKDRKQNRYLSLDETKISKDHTLGAADAAFIREMIRSSALDAVFSGAAEPSWFRFVPNHPLNLDVLLFDGPSYVVGDSATVTFRTLSNVPFEERIYVPTTQEEYLYQNILYYPWVEEEKYYFTEGNTPMEEALTAPETPDPKELFTVEQVADDLSAFTITFHKPGMYWFWRYSAPFYLIGPDQATPAAVAAEMDAVVEKMKNAATEKDAARLLYQWIRRKVKYNTPAFEWEKHPEVTIRDLKTKAEAIGALAYGKCVCAGYAGIYDLLMRQAGLTDLFITGQTQPGDVEHAWNVNRLDGVWSYTDPTWGRFDWTPEKMNKDHWCYNEDNLNAYCFGSAFDLLADQLAEDYAPPSMIPRALKFLPRAAEGYGFDEQLAGLAEVAKLKADDSGISVALSRPERIRLTLLKNGKLDRNHKDDSTDPVKQFSTSSVQGSSFRLEIGGVPTLDYIEAPIRYQAIDYVDGEPSFALCKIYVPVEVGLYGNLRYSYQDWILGSDMKPRSVGWYLKSLEWKLELDVFFDEDGNVSTYKVKYWSGADKTTSSWEATADGVVTVFNKKKVKDPDSVDLSRIDPVYFE